MEKHANKNLF